MMKSILLIYRFISKPIKMSNRFVFDLGENYLNVPVTCEGNTDRELDHYLLKVKVHLPGDLEFSFSIPTLESSWHAHKQQTHSLFF